MWLLFGGVPMWWSELRILLLQVLGRQNALTPFSKSVLISLARELTRKSSCAPLPHMSVLHLAPGSHTRLYTSRTEFNCASPQHLAQNLTPNWYSLFVKWKNGWFYQDPSFFTTLPITALCIPTCKPSTTHRSFLDSGDPVSLFQLPPWLSWYLSSTALYCPNSPSCSSLGSPSSLPPATLLPLEIISPPQGWPSYWQADLSWILLEFLHT